MRAKYLLLLLPLMPLAACGSGEDSHAVEWLFDPEDVSSEALKAAVSDPDSRRFYEARGWKAVWTDDLLHDVVDTIHRAPEHALLPNMFLPDAIPQNPAQREAALTKAALAFANTLAHGRTDPHKLFEIYELPRNKVDVVSGLAAAIADESVGEWLSGLAPQTEEYRALSKAFLEYARQSSAGAQQGIQSGEALKVGAKDPRVPRLVEALKSSGYLPADFAPAQNDQTYSEPIARAVAAFQRDYGIEDDGIVGADTLEILNTSDQKRARQIAVNMERRRWLSREVPATRIDVNTAATILEYWRDGQLRDRRVVVTGQPDWETPELASPMFQLVANPTWTVPESIEKDELAAKGAAYFASQGIVRKDGRLVQMPGPKNALGKVKFDLKNNHAIYLHDTPAKALFQTAERHASHGCVRVSDALGFAQLIATDEGVSDKFGEAASKEDTAFIALKRQIPVRLIYHTVHVEDGQIRFRPDAYGWDDLVAVALGRPQAILRKPKARHGEDIGP